MKRLLLNALKLILFLAGIGNLALSQIHISAVTKIFANQIGLFLFLFIIFGLTTGLNGVLLEKPRSLISFVGSGIIATISGIIYLRLLQADIAQQEELTLAAVSDSWQMVIASIGIYLIGSLIVAVLSWPELKALSKHA